MINFFSRLSLIATSLFLLGTSAFAQIPVANFTSDRTSGCSPVQINFTGTSTGTPTSYSWNFGDGGTSTLKDPSKIYSTPGVYTVTLVATNASGSDTEVKTAYITVFRNPVASFTVSEDTVCSTSSVIFTSTSTPGDGAINLYEWAFRDGSLDVTGVSTVSHQFIFSSSVMETFIPILTINDDNNCNSSVTDTIYVFPQPTASFNPDLTNACTVPATIPFTNTSQFTTQFSWNFGDTASSSNSSSLQNPSHTYNAGGSYTVTLTSGVPGCSASQTSIINIASPIADFTASDTVVCIGDTVSFTNTGTSGNYFWNFADPSSGGNNTSNLADPTHAFVTPGTHSVSLIVSIGACTNTINKTITVRPSPIPMVFAPVTRACAVPFTATFSDTVSTNASWTWDFGDPASGAQNSSNLQNPSHTYNSFGIYTINHTVTDIFGCSASATYNSYIQIIQPTIDFTESDSGCVGSTFNFNAMVSSPADPIVSDYTWRFGDGTGPHSSGNLPSIAHTFNSVGVFDVTLTITTSTGCTTTLVKQAYIRIGTPPVANFSATPISICFDDNVQFTDLTSTPVTGWLWDFGDGQGSTSQNPNHQFKYDTSGVADPFDIQLISFYNGCPDTIVIQDMITVLGPIPNFSIVYNCPNPYLVAFTNLSGGATSYLWDFGDSSPTSTVTDPTHTYANRGTFTVTLTATSTVSGCVIDTVYDVRVTDPIANLVTDTNTVCRPGIINFTGSGSTDAVSRIWYFGEGIANVLDTSVFADTLHLYNTPGFYNVQLIVTDIHGCTNSATQQVHVIGPTAGFAASPFSGCAPMTVTFNDTSKTEGGAIAQWVWNYGSVSHTITTPPGTDTLTYTTAGNYTVILTVTDVNGCSNSFTATNYIQPTKPIPTIVPPDSSCRNVQQTFVGNPGPFVASPVTYQWSFGDNTNATVVGAPTVNHTYPNNGSYPLKLVVTDANGCVDSTTSNIFIYTTSANFSTVLYNDTCINQEFGKQAQVKTIFSIDDSSHMTHSPSTYSWDFTEQIRTHPSLSSAAYTFYSAGSYGVGLIVTNDFGCMDTVMKPDLVVLNGPTGTLTLAPDSGCSPLTVNFVGSGTNVNYYAWDFADGNVISNTQTTVLSHTYTSTGIYHPKLYMAYIFDTLSNEECLIQVPSTDSVIVTSLVNVNIIEDSIYVLDGQIDTLHVITANPGGQPLIYTWNPAAHVSQDPVITNTFYATTNGVDSYYYVEVAYGISGCSGIDSVLVLYIPCEGVVKIPNVFTPNNDSKNDTYHIDELCDFDGFRFVIYNRWGKIIFESTDANFHWDGKTTGGTEASEGVYYYVLNSKTQDYKGYIQLIRE